MIHKSYSLDQAAMLICRGGKFVRASGSWPNCAFTIETTKLALTLINWFPFVNYVKFVGARGFLKHHAKRSSGIGQTIGEYLEAKKGLKK